MKNVKLNVADLIAIKYALIYDIEGYSKVKMKEVVKERRKVLCKVLQLIRES